MNKCDYGCGQDAITQFKNGKYCCHENHRKCPQRIKEQRERGKSQTVTNKNCNNVSFEDTHVERSILLEWIDQLENSDKKSKYWTKKWIDKISPEFYPVVMTLTKDVEMTGVTLVKRIWLVKHNLVGGISCRICNTIHNPPVKTYGEDIETYKNKLCSKQCSRNADGPNRVKSSYDNLITLSETQTVKPLFTLSEYQGIKKNYKWQCEKCNYIFESRTYCGQLLTYPQCYKCRSEYGNELEKKIKAILDECEVDYIFRDREVLNGKELDFYIPDYQLAIEVDGLYWHSETYMGKTNHIEKTNTCFEQGVELIHILEDEIENKLPIIKSKLQSKFQKNRRVFARQTKIKIITPQEKNTFLEENHMQGKDTSKIHLGMFYKNELTAVMTFSHLRNIMGRDSKENCYELSRYCSKNNTNVIGGFSKLLKYFEVNYNPKEITTYADRRWGTGEVYLKSGFEFTHTSKPNYWYFQDKKRFHRAKFQKHKLKDLLDDFDPNLTEVKNMENNGWNRIFDCGSNVFNKKYLAS